MQTVYLYNEYFSFLPRLKKFFGKSGRGPEAVFSSLTKGLNELGIDYQVNQIASVPIDTACVLSGVSALRWAIGQKQKGRVKKIIAGTNIVVTPDEVDGILKSPEIDKILVPGLWVKDFYISQAPELSSKIYIWAAGVDVPPAGDEKKEFDFLIFVKNYGPIFNAIIEYLENKPYKFKVMAYGKFKQANYFEALKTAKYLIYLSESESQGLAMFEAWARNIPTLVWERGFMQYGKYRFEGTTATPYLTEQTGMKFKDFEEFKQVLPEFINKKFSPRQWVENNATNRIAAQKYLEIINV